MKNKITNESIKNIKNQSLKDAFLYMKEIQFKYSVGVEKAEKLQNNLIEKFESLKREYYITTEENCWNPEECEQRYGFHLEEMEEGDYELSQEEFCEDIEDCFQDEKNEYWERFTERFVELKEELETIILKDDFRTQMINEFIEMFEASDYYEGDI